MGFTITLPPSGYAFWSVTYTNNKQANVSSLQECLNLCVQLSGCVGGTYNPNLIGFYRSYQSWSNPPSPSPNASCWYTDDSYLGKGDTDYANTGSAHDGRYSNACPENDYSTRNNIYSTTYSFIANSFSVNKWIGINMYLFGSIATLQ